MLYVLPARALQQRWTATRYFMWLDPANLGESVMTRRAAVVEVLRVDGRDPWSRYFGTPCATSATFWLGPVAENGRHIVTVGSHHTTSVKVGCYESAYTMHHVDTYGPAHQLTPDRCILYKCGYFSATLPKLKNFLPISLIHSRLDRLTLL